MYNGDKFILVMVHKQHTSYALTSGLCMIAQSEHFIKEGNEMTQMMFILIVSNMIRQYSLTFVINLIFLLN